MILEDMREREREKEGDSSLDYGMVPTICFEVT